MSDAKTLRMAFRPMTPDGLERYLRLVKLERQGHPHPLTEVGLPSEDASRIGAAVNAFCRPRLLKRRLLKAAPANPEAAERQKAALAAPIDDTEFVELYGEETHRVLLANEAAVVEARAISAGEG